jgi:hypothetical protein
MLSLRRSGAQFSRQSRVKKIFAGMAKKVMGNNKSLFGSQDFHRKNKMRFDELMLRFL